MKRSILVLIALATTLACGIVTGLGSDSERGEPVLEEPGALAFQTHTPTVVTDFSNQDTSFSSDNLNDVPPEDIIDEINYFGGMGGCGRFCQCMFAENDRPTLFTRKAAVEIFQSIDFEICRPDENEYISVVVELPDGSKQQFEHAGSSGIEYVPGLHDPQGLYTFIFSGNGWMLKENIRVKDANGPRLYLTLESKLILYKFNPGERVRIFAYERSPETDNARLIGWKEYIVDNNGGLTIPTDLIANFIAIGESSGQVYHLEEAEWSSWTRLLGSNSVVYCEGVPAGAGIHYGGTAEVLEDTIPVYAYDPYEGTVDGINNEYFGAGTTVNIMSNAYCIDGKILWEVRCLNQDCGGTIPEADLEEVYLRQLDENVPGKTVDSSFRCRGAVPSQVTAGKKARVTISDGRPVRLRVTPGFSGLILDRIPEGTIFKVINGPQCREEFAWWEIELENGVIGWVAEGEEDSYYIEPY